MIKNQYAEKPLKSRKTRSFISSYDANSDGSDGFSDTAKITDPTAPVTSSISFSQKNTKWSDAYADMKQEESEKSSRLLAAIFWEKAFEI